MPVVMTTVEQASALLDFNKKLDIGLLDSVVACFYSSDGPEQKAADQVLTQLKQHPDSWTRVDSILEFSKSLQTKYFALQVLETVIKTRWKVLPREQCDGIKKYIVGLIIKDSMSADNQIEKDKSYLGKLNMILVEILKHEWPKKWPAFISDIVGASKANETICENNMKILKLLSEEVFDFSSGQLTQTKAKHLKDSMCSEFSQIFTLCQYVMENSQNVPLVDATLQTLLKFLNWIPLGYIFETKLVSTFIYKFLNVPMFRNVTLKCLTEIAGISATQYNEQFTQLYTLTMTQLKQMLPLTTNIKEAYNNGRDDEQKFIQNLSLFLCTFLKEHGQLIEAKVDLHTTLLEVEDEVGNNIMLTAMCYANKRTVDSFLDYYAAVFHHSLPSYLGIVLEHMLKPALCIISPAESYQCKLDTFGLCTLYSRHVDLCNKLVNSMSMHYLVLISEVEEIEIFKICLEYWNSLAGDLYRESPFSSSTSPLLIGSIQQQHVPPRRQIYLQVLSKVRITMISRMAKPEEVLVVENDQGEVVREFLKDTDAINLYKNMRETLVYLTHLDYQDTEIHMTEKLQAQVDGTEWSWKNLNTLCWAIGSISGAMHEEDEKRFLVTVIKDLLGLCEIKRGKDNKAIIASNIMYIVGQYPRFLRAHWKFLKTVVNKLFEFMHETHDGVQDMACDTFIKIAQKCRRHFVQVQVGEVMPFIEEILNTIQTIICDLQPQQIHTFYEAVGYMISAQSDSVVQERLIEKYMSLPNHVWDNIIKDATKNVDTLKNMEIIKQLSNILKTNVHGCRSIGHPFVTQLGRIYLDMLNVYRCLSENISSAVAANGPVVAKQPLIRAMRGAKTETLKLIATWVNKSNDAKLVCDNFIPPLLEAVLADYQRNFPAAREPEVLTTMATLTNKLGHFVTEHVPQILDAVFGCTLEMINKDMEEWPEHRTNFFLLLQAVVEHCFSALLKVPAEQFKLVLDSIVWAFKHTMRNVADTGLEILYSLLKNVEKSEGSSQSFYQTYYTMILQHIFSVVTDTSHTAGLNHHATILSHMFHLLEAGKIVTPLYDAAQCPGVSTNQAYIKQYVANLLKQAFPHLQAEQIRVLVEGFFTLNQDIPAFKEHLRDFLVQIKEFRGEDVVDLFLVEREVELKKAQEEKRQMQLTVPGIINPHDMPEEMQD